MPGRKGKCSFQKITQNILRTAGSLTQEMMQKVEKSTLGPVVSIYLYIVIVRLL